MPSSFEIVGVLLAVWAVVVAFLGIRNPDFPGSQRAERVVAGVTMLLVAGAVTTGILSSSHEYEEKQKAKAAVAP